MPIMLRRKGKATNIAYAVLKTPKEQRQDVKTESRTVYERKDRRI